MKRRILRAALAVSLLLSLAVPASAARGAHTLTRQGAGEDVVQDIRFGVRGPSGAFLEKYGISKYGGYYAISRDAAWTVANTSEDPDDWIAVSATFYAPLGDHDFGNDGDAGTMIGRDGQLLRDAVIPQNQDKLLGPGDCVTFTLADLLADAATASYLADLNQTVGRDPGAVDGLALTVEVFDCRRDRDGATVRAFSSVSYPYVIGGGAPAAGDFIDVQESDWFYEAVSWAVENGVTTGTSATTFSPYQDCTEAQILTFLWRAAGSPEPSEAVELDTFYAKAVAWAAEEGMISAEGFAGFKPCTRGTAVGLLWAAAGWPEADAAPFEDIPSDIPYYVNAAAWAVENGITNGTSETTFSPWATCSRGQIVTFLYRAFAE